MENRAHLPLWFKERVGQVLSVGRHRAGKQAWDVVRDTFGDCAVETVTSSGEPDSGEERLQVAVPLPGAGNPMPVSWNRIEAFRSRFGLKLEAQVSEGETILLLEFSP